MSDVYICLVQAKIHVIAEKFIRIWMKFLSIMYLDKNWVKLDVGRFTLTVGKYHLLSYVPWYHEICSTLTSFVNYINFTFNFLIDWNFMMVYKCYASKWIICLEGKSFLHYWMRMITEFIVLICSI